MFLILKIISMLCLAASLLLMLCFFVGFQGASFLVWHVMSSPYWSQVNTATTVI